MRGLCVVASGREHLVDKVGFRTGTTSRSALSATLLRILASVWLSIAAATVLHLHVKDVTLASELVLIAPLGGAHLLVECEQALVVGAFGLLFGALGAQLRLEALLLFESQAFGLASPRRLQTQAPVATQRYEASHARLYGHDGAHLARTILLGQVGARPPLQAHDERSQRHVASREQTRPVRGLEAHEAASHESVAASRHVAAPRALYEQSAVLGAHELASLGPAAYAALEDEDLVGEDLFAHVLDVDVLGVLEEELGAAELVVDHHGLATLSCCCRVVRSECDGADASGRCRALAGAQLVRGQHGVDQQAIAVHEVAVHVPDRVAGAPDPDRLHHARVAQLTHHQLTVEQLATTFTKTNRNLTKQMQKCTNRRNFKYLAF